MRFNSTGSPQKKKKNSTEREELLRPLRALCNHCSSKTKNKNPKNKNLKSKRTKHIDLQYYFSSIGYFPLSMQE